MTERVVNERIKGGETIAGQARSHREGGNPLWERACPAIELLLPGIDLVEHATVVEVGLLHGAPVTEGLLDREEVHLREAVGVLGQDFSSRGRR